MILKPNKLEFESLGEDQVQARVSASIWSEEKSREAREWLKRERNQIARSAKNAAWTAAIAAIISAIAAAVAIAISFVSKG